MKERFGNKAKKVSLLAGSSGVAALTLFGAMKIEADIPSFNEALIAQGLTTDQYSNLNASIKPLRSAQEHLEYTPPDCYTAIGLFRICSPEELPSVPDALQELSKSEEHLKKTKESDSLQALEDIKASLSTEMQLDKPITIETHSAQRLAIQQTANNLEIRAETVSSEIRDATTRSHIQGLVGGLLMTTFSVSSVIAVGTALSFSKRIRQVFKS